MTPLTPAPVDLGRQRAWAARPGLGRWANGSAPGKRLQKPSFPRKRESRIAAFRDSPFRGNDGFQLPGFL